jgi:hypothetical protein
MEGMAKNTWRERYVWGRLDTVLILWELILSVIFVSLGYLTGGAYVRGVGVGLIIAWVTSAIVYLIRKRS